MEGLVEAGNAAIRGGREVAGPKIMEIRETIRFAKRSRKRPHELRMTNGKAHKVSKSPIAISWIGSKTYAGRKPSKSEATERPFETLGIESM